MAPLTVICIDERLADAQRRAARRLQVNRDERTWRRSSAGQEERLSLLDESMIPITERIVAQIRPIVSHPNRDGCLLSVGWRQVRLATG